MTEVRAYRATRRRRGPGLHRRCADSAGAGPARLTAESALLGLAVGVLVVAPWTSPGHLLLLDWISGPHQTLTSGLYGLDPAAVDALPYRLLTQAVRAVTGSGATSWLMILAYFPIAAGGVSAIARGGRWRRYPAALFVCVNPFVVERLQAGHVPFLLSVALLCPMTASALHARRRDRWFAVRPAGWYALAVSVGAHAAWLGAVVLVAVAVLPRPRRRDLVRTAGVIAVAGCSYAYAAAIVAGVLPTVRIGDQDLQVYATYPGSAGLAVAVATLRGFWRGGADSSPVVAVGLVPGTVLVAAALFGLVRLCRRDRATGLPMAVVTAAGLLLGAGVAGPLGSLYRLAFHHLPLFSVMREQQKWVALAMIGYAVGTGVTAERVAEGLRAHSSLRSRAAAVAAVPALAGVYAVVGATLLWGLGGTVQVSHYPRAWYAADRIMGSGDESVLFLPWHQYQPFAFTAGRSVASPAAAFFRRPVLSSDAAELGPVRTNSVSRRMAYLDRLIAAGGGGRFGRLIAPLGVRYVLLAKGRAAAVYAWLAEQKDLLPVLRTADLDLYRVTETGTGRVVAARDGDFTDVLSWAADGRLGTEAVLADADADADADAGAGALPSAASGALRRAGATRWRVAAGSAGWVVLPEEWSARWTAGDLVTRPTVAGTIAVRGGSGAFTVRYAPWIWLRFGLLTSLLLLAGVLVVGLLEYRREWSGGVRRPDRSDPSGGGGGS